MAYVVAWLGHAMKPCSTRDPIDGAEAWSSACCIVAQGAEKVVLPPGAHRVGSVRVQMYMRVHLVSTPRLIFGQDFVTKTKGL